MCLLLVAFLFRAALRAAAGFRVSCGKVERFICPERRFCVRAAVRGIQCRMALYGVTDKIAEELGVRIREEVGAAELTTFRGGGRAARVYEPADADALARFLMRSAEQGAADFYLLGGGSNTVMEDGEILLPAVLTRDAAEIIKTAEDERGVFIRAECGAPLAKIISFGREHSAGGLEFLAGVPATAGGAVHMNAGAFGHEIADYIVEIERLTPDFAEIERIKKEEAAFGYRRGAAGAVLRADFFLPRMSAEESVRRAAEFLAERRRRQPCAPSCGSVFRRGVLPAGALIEKAGLKGVRLGGAEISRVHANFIVNVGGASAADFQALARLAEERVFELFGERLEREVEFFSDGLPF